MSRNKGKAGERELAKRLSQILKVEARRAQQYCGAAGDDLTDKALKEEFGDKADELDDDAIEKWLESKVGNTTNFKKINESK